VPDPEASAEGGQRRLPAPLLRASDADRELVVEQLRDHAAEGRLTLAELGHRRQSALAAPTGAELAELLADLPEPAAPRGPRKPRRWFAALPCSSSRRPPGVRLLRRIVSITVMASPDIDFRDAELSSAKTMIYCFALLGWPDI
jgi:Domain of unknown function (DUF1707)